MLRILEALLVVLGVVGTCATVFWFMDDRHAQDSTVKTRFLKEDWEQADSRAKGYAELRYHYCKKVDMGTADDADKERCEYSKENMIRQQKEADRIQSVIDMVEHK